jgi:hypothetical protein
MKNVISYTLFEPKQLFNHRNGWDKYNTIERYWFNIPAVICINKILYPNFNVKIHISPNIKEHKLYKLFESLERDFGVSIEVIERDYKKTEPTVWRYKPLLEKECDILLCRDIDSIPTADEVLSVYYFIQNDEIKISTMRSHYAHAGPPTIMMAGLCSFKVKDINVGISFDELLDISDNSEWGIDQQFLIQTLTKDKEWNKNHFLDCKLSNKDHKVCNSAIECISLDQNHFRKNVRLSDIGVESDVLSLLNDYVVWAGEPVDIRGEKLKNILNLEYDVCKKMSSVLENNQELKEFYL